MSEDDLVTVAAFAFLAWCIWHEPELEPVAIAAAPVVVNDGGAAGMAHAAQVVGGTACCDSCK